MDRWKGRVALVTGASVGIGAAVARGLVQQGMRVVGCGRSVDKIEVRIRTGNPTLHDPTLSYPTYPPLPLSTLSDV